MAKESRRGDREIRNPKAAKLAVAAPISRFAVKSPTGAGARSSGRAEAGR